MDFNAPSQIIIMTHFHLSSHRIFAFHECYVSECFNNHHYIKIFLQKKYITIPNILFENLNMNQYFNTFR